MQDEYVRDLAQAYNGVRLYSRAVAGTLPSLRAVLAEAQMSFTRTHTADARSMQFEMLSEHLGVAFRPISPEAIAALERLTARG